MKNEFLISGQHVKYLEIFFVLINFSRLSGPPFLNQGKSLSPKAAQPLNQLDINVYLHSSV